MRCLKLVIRTWNGLLQRGLAMSVTGQLLVSFHTPGIDLGMAVKACVCLFC